MNKELNEKDLDEIGWALLNLSQDIRFAIFFEMTDHETLATHLEETLKNIDVIDMIIFNGKIAECKNTAEKITDEIFKLKGFKNE